MATVAIFTDTEEGHIIPTFRLSRHLKAGGHRICYLGPLGVEGVIRGQGFEFISIFNDILKNSPQNSSQGKKDIDDALINSYFRPLVSGQLLDGTIAELRPGVALVNYHNPLEGLAIRYRYRVPVIFYGPSLITYSRENEAQCVIERIMELKSGLTEFLELLAGAGLRIRNFGDVAQLMRSIPKLIFIPKSFDRSGKDDYHDVHYPGAGIDMERNEQPFSWAGIDSSRPVIYCARGSQLHLQMEANRRLLQVTIDAAAARPEWQFIIVISKIFKADDFSGVPPNVILSNWAPQLEVLSCSDVMINHGGFGTIKECIYTGTPMIVLPLKGPRDHSDCADLVVYHGLGVKNDDPQISPNELILLIEQVISDPSFKHRVNQMREKFKQEDRIDLAVRVIERTIVASI